MHSKRSQLELTALEMLQLPDNQNESLGKVYAESTRNARSLVIFRFFEILKFNLEIPASKFPSVPRPCFLQINTKQFTQTNSIQQTRRFVAQNKTRRFPPANCSRKKRVFSLRHYSQRMFLRRCYFPSRCNIISSLSQKQFGWKNRPCPDSVFRIRLFRSGSSGR